jgi:phosphohistidine phosphatase
MELLVVRHAPAGDREEFLRTHDDDRERPLTGKGARRMRRGARALRRLVPELDLIVSSPLRRAAETAAIVADEAYGGVEVVELEALAPGAPRADRVRFLAERDPEARLALVGHAPDLDEDVSWLLAGVSHPFVQLGKGGACLLDLPGEIDAGRAELQWLLALRQLRRLR